MTRQHQTSTKTREEISGQAEYTVVHPNAETHAIIAAHKDFKGHSVQTNQVFLKEITPSSHVAVSICELSSTGQPFAGSAPMTVNNVVPGRENIIVRTTIDYGTDINYRLNFIIIT